jgi:hypothetical protein
MSDKIIMTCQHCCQPITLEAVNDGLLRVFKTCGCDRGPMTQERVQ